ncbi:MAG: hypothetical protein ABFD76_15160 [Smithella sp.]
MQDVEIKTVDTILDQGVRVPVPTPFFLRWFGLQAINLVVKRPVIGNMLRISKMYIKMNMEEKEAETDWRKWIDVFQRTAKPVSRIVAIGMLRGRISGWLFCRPLAWWLRWHVDTKTLSELAALLVSLSGIQDFMNTITFLRGMKITAPSNVSQ